jgi:hypothetical protein
VNIRSNKNIPDSPFALGELDNWIKAIRNGPITIEVNQSCREYFEFVVTVDIPL